MQCVIYKSRTRRSTYLYVAQESDIARVPSALLEQLGQLEFVMRLELRPERRLAQADPREVCRQLEQQGYYLQLPPADPPAALS